MTGTIKCFNQHTVGYPLKELVLKMYTDENCKGDYAYFSAYGAQNGNVYASFQFKKAGTISYTGLDGFVSCELDAITLQNGYVLSMNHNSFGKVCSIESGDRNKAYINLGGYWNRITGEDLIIDFTAVQLPSSIQSGDLYVLVEGTQKRLLACKVGSSGNITQLGHLVAK